jgi:hypothetical protein
LADRGHSTGPSFLKTQPNRAAKTVLDSPNLAARINVLIARFEVREDKNLGNTDKPWLNKTKLSATVGY